MKPFGYQRRSYKPPGKDSARAIADVRTFLTNARLIDHLFVQQLAERYNLKLATAGRELAAAKVRRSSHGNVSND